MINKKNLWFLTLFSLVLVLSIYYVTMPNELLVTTNGKLNEVNYEISESDIVSALKIEDNNTILEEITTLKEKLTKKDSTIEEKNVAFEALKKLNNISSKEETLENKLKAKYDFESFIKIDEDQIRVIVDSNDQGAKIANAIMQTIQEEFENKMYISVKFQE